MQYFIREFVFFRNGKLMLRKYLATISIVTLTILASCNGGGDSVTNGSSVSLDPFPLSVGSQWQYDVTDRVTTKRIISVVGTKLVDGLNVFVLNSNDAEYAFYNRTDSAITQLPVGNADAYTRAIGPRVILKLPLRSGDKWVQVDKSLTIENKVTMELTDVLVRDPEDVVTPAGYFKGAYPVFTNSKFTTSDAGSTTGATTFQTKTEWVVLGVGVVRRETKTISPSSFERQVSELLSSYSIVKP
jgi:hypothetical protein